jgi:hypothetical protein
VLAGVGLPAGRAKAGGGGRAPSGATIIASEHHTARVGSWADQGFQGSHRGLGPM